MRIKYNVTIDDLLFFNEHHFGKNKQIQKMLFRNILIFCVSFAVIMVYFAYKSGAWSYSIIVGVIACTLYALT